VSNWKECPSCGVTDDQVRFCRYCGAAQEALVSTPSTSLNKPMAAIKPCTNVHCEFNSDIPHWLNCSLRRKRFVRICFHYMA
jgi:hypothetical protein